MGSVYILVTTHPEHESQWDVWKRWKGTCRPAANQRFQRLRANGEGCELRLRVIPALLAIGAAVVSVSAAAPAAASEDPLKIPAIASFLADGGFGKRNPKSPVEIEQFGRLAGLWRTEQEIRKRDGGWVQETSGYWVWKYVIDGFAVQDLWYQGADSLPSYMGSLGRSYQLTAVRIYEAASKEWKIAWMANGAGATPGQDFGTFRATLEGDSIVMTTPPAPGAFGLQRVVFSEIEQDSFLWVSEYSQDEGKTWNAVMRVKAKRLR